MTITLADIQTTKKPDPPNIVIHGVPGVGKTTFAASAPSPIVIMTEDGLGLLDVPHFPLATKFQDVMEALKALIEQEHDFKTLVVDSLDWLEPLIWEQACKENNFKNISSPDFGKGYAAALDLWRDYIKSIKILRTKRNMAVIQIAHTEIKTFQSPQTDPYDRYIIKLHKRAEGLIKEHADVVLFANYLVDTVEKKISGGKTTRGIGSGQRVIYTEERPAFLAKNRFNLPESLPLSWQAFQDALTDAITKTKGQ